MPSSLRLLSADEYERLPDEPGYRTELSYGMVVREPQPGAVHGDVTVKLAFVLTKFVNDRQLGRVTCQTGFLIRRNPDCVRGPDVGFVRQERVPAEPPRSFWPFAPDLAIEVVSPGNTLAELQQKTMEYFDGGTREVWIIEPKTRTATIYHSLDDIAVLRGDRVLESRELLPGFSLRLADLFAW